MLTGAKEINSQGTFMVSHRKKKKKPFCPPHLRKLCLDVKQGLHGAVELTS